MVNLLPKKGVNGLGGGWAWVAKEGKEGWQEQLKLGSPTERMLRTPEGVGIGRGGWASDPKKIPWSVVHRLCGHYVCC